MRRRRRERPRPMPTEEDKKKAQIKAAGADPLVWAMKSVDEKFPDSREKSEVVDDADEEIEEVEEIEEEEEKVEEATPEPKNTEIKAEGKLAMPMDEGVMTMEVKPMRQNTDEAKKAHEVKKVKGKLAEKALKTETKVDPKTEVKLTALESKQKKMVTAFIGLIVFALAAVIFAVITIVNQKNTAENFEDQTVSFASSNNDNVEDGYINLKDWKMKIKVISGLDHISFDYDNDEYSAVMIWGARKNLEADYTPDFAKQSKNTNPLGVVTRVPRYERAAAGRLIWYDDFYNYYYQGPTGEPEAEESEMSWWVESYLLIKDMLTDADNYIKYDDGGAIGNK